MSVAGSCSSLSNCSPSSSYISAYDSNQLRQGEKSNGLSLNDENPSNKQTTEYVFRGELLEEASENNGFRPQKDQNIDPANQDAINSYENNSTPIDTLAFKEQGAILDAYA